jgi:hypothetical protein
MGSSNASWSAQLSPVSSKAEVWDRNGRLVGVMRRGVFYETGRVGALNTVWNEQGDVAGAIDDNGEFVHHDSHELEGASL